MTSPYKLFKTNPDAEVNGTVINYGDEAWFRVARSGGANKKYLAAMTDRLKPFRRQIQTETMDEKVADRLVLEVFVDTVLLGWGSYVERPVVGGKPDEVERVSRDGIIEGPEGEDITFGRDSALKVLTDLPELFRELRAESERLGTFATVTKEVDAKN